MPDEDQRTPTAAHEEPTQKSEKEASGRGLESPEVQQPTAPPGEPDQAPPKLELEEPSPPEAKEPKFLVVGIGASAGGLEALTELIRYIPVDGVAYIVVQHLAPEHVSILPQLLGRNARLPVATAADGMTLEPGRMYVIPPNSDLAVMHGALHVITPPSTNAPRLPADYLFRSIAEDYGPLAIGVVVSGTGTDGTLGLKAIKAAGGFTFAQDPETAKYDGMPRSAAHNGAADFCLPLEEIGMEIARIAKQPHVRRAIEPYALPVEHVRDELGKIFVLIRAEFGTDLSHYKMTTIDRRLERRMTMNKIGRLADYIRYLRSNRDELAALYKDMLITVTSFFREPEAFEALRSSVFPQLLERKAPGQPIRVWVPACATGEEAYSIAMCLVEFCEAKGQDRSITIFATDVDDACIRAARHGVYPPNIAIDVSADRLNRFFVKKDSEYQVSRRIRDLLVFSRHNILRDAPFSKMDFVSCRNLLIYLQPPAQRKVLRVLHYALNPSGYMLLGPSETVGDAPELFDSVDRKNKIYVRKQVTLPIGLEMAFVPTPLEPAQQPAPVRPGSNVQLLGDRKVLELYAPAGVIITEDFEIIQFRGHTGPYLDPLPGAPSFNLLRVARFELHIELRKAIQQAITQQQRVTTEVTYAHEGKQSVVMLDVMPLVDPERKSRCLLVLFNKIPEPREVAVVAPTEGETGETALPLAHRLQELERELGMTKEYLQTITEEKESALEELKSANEELQSSNEELQSTNEELETSKEEMQSTNEELTTVNEELQHRMTELSQSNDDLHNVLSGVDNAVIIVGMDLKIRRYTTAAEKLFNLVPADIGRSIGFLDGFLQTGALEPKVTSAIQNLASVEEEVLANNHRWYGLKVTPYKTLDHAIRGGLVTLVDIDVRKRAEEMTRNVTAYASTFLAAIGHPLLIVDQRLRVVWTNDLFLSTFQLTTDETVGSILQTVAAGHFGNPKLRQRIEDTFASGSPFRDCEIRLQFPEGGERLVRVGGSQVPAFNEKLVLVSMEPLAEISPRGTE